MPDDKAAVPGQMGGVADDGSCRIVSLPKKDESLYEMFKHAELDGWKLVSKHLHTTDSVQICAMLLIKDRTL